MIRPVDAPVSQRFGENPTKHLPWDSWLIQTFGNYQPDGHSGQDYACDAGTPVRAVTSGTVRHIGWMGGSYAENPWWIMPSFAGYVVVVDHGAFIGIYGHCMDGSGRVKAGQRVSEGQVVALSGNSGASTGPHLHFEILPDQYILNSPMYGRTDPENLFTGTIQTQSVTTKEDTLSAEEVKQIKDHINAVLLGGYQWRDADGVIRKHPGVGMVVEENQRRIAAIPASVWATPVVRTGGNVSALQELADTKTKVLGIEPAIARIDANTDPAALADLIPDALAQQVIDKLAERLAK